MTDQHPITPPTEPLNTARCLGSGSYEDGTWHWREGCDDCQRRYGWAGGWIEPPPIIAFECEYRIGPDEIVAQGEHAPPPKPLSPAAEAIFFAADGMQPLQYRGRALAAALRALADQVKPTLARTPWLTNEDGYFNETFENMETLGELNVHYRLLAIATELEAFNG